MNSKIILAIGFAILMIGAILHFFPNAFKWFGNLPGDFKSTDGNFKFYFPLVSMILVSFFFNIFLRLYRHFF